MKADFILANPPFNISDWGGERLKDDQRWKYGIPPAGNANYAWVQHMVHHLSPNGTAGFILANGSMSSNSGGEGDIRKALVEADLVDCMVAMPGQLFYSTQIPVCLWFICRNKRGKPSPQTPLPVGEGQRDRRGEILFIDARKLGSLVDRDHREISDEEIKRIAKTYAAWKQVAPPHPASGHPLPKGEGTEESSSTSGGGAGGEGYIDVPGFCKSANLDEIARHGYVLTPGRYVGAEELEDDGIPFEEKMQDLTARLYSQMEESAQLDKVIRKNLTELGYGK